MNDKPHIYILAGANGIGKTTVNSFFIPQGVPFINADDIAKQLKLQLGNINVQELANAQAIERMNQYILKRENFAIETNLADNETWQFLKGLQGLGYILNLHFFGASDVNMCIDRVKNRVFHGGHFVRPDIVRWRYENGLKLLQINKNIPDRLILTDNEHESTFCLEMQFGEIVFKNEKLPEWVKYVLSEEKQHFKPPTSIDEIREKYRKMKDKKIDDDY